MSESMMTQYKKALKRCLDIEMELEALPDGYISTKVIYGKTQHYLQKRVGKKIVGKYISDDEVDAVKQGLSKRTMLTTELAEVNARISDLETAARLVSIKTYNSCLLLKACMPMEHLSFENRRKASSFAYSMNAIEGVYATEETRTSVGRWIEGEETFLSVYESTLKKYGFPVEVR